MSESDDKPTGLELWERRSADMKRVGLKHLSALRVYLHQPMWIVSARIRLDYVQAHRWKRKESEQRRVSLYAPIEIVVKLIFLLRR